MIAYSEFIKKDIGKYVAGKPISVLPLGIYGGLCPGIIDKKFNTQGKFAVLFFGRIEPYKGVDVLIDAMDILSRDDLDIRLTMAGRGKVSNRDLERIAALKIDFQNRWITDAELCSLVNDADVLVAPYKKATQSGIVSVGLACHIPMITTREGSFPEYVVDGVNGFLIDGSAEDLAAKIRALYADRGLLEKMSRGSEAIADNFAWTIIAKKAIRLYQGEDI